MESIAPVTACSAASAVPFATMGLRPCVSILPSRSTSPTATLVPPISTPRMAPLRLGVFSHGFAIVAICGRLENCTLMVLISYGLVCKRDSAIVHGDAAHRLFHQIGFHCRLCSRRKLKRNLAVLAGPFVEAQNERVLVFGFLQRGHDDVVRLRLQKRMLRRERSLMFFDRAAKSICNSVRNPAGW